MAVSKLKPIPITPELIIHHLESLKGSKSTEKEENSFPAEIFPTALQKIIKATNDSLNFPIDFVGASMLYAASVAIGNSCKVEVLKGYQQNVSLYISIVGRRGTNKSHPLSFFLKPLEDRDEKNFEKYRIEKQEYDTNIKLSKKDRDNQQIDDPILPIWEQLLVTDFTPEALIEVHKFNKNGIGVYADELASWFKNFNRYNSGSEEQFWLSVWSGKPIRINRKTSEPIFISLPFISVIGTIQPAVLKELAKDRTENGFMDRILFVIPDDLKKNYWSETQLELEVEETWKTIITNILDIHLNQNENLTPTPTIIKFSPEAKDILRAWQRKITDLCNESNDDILVGIYAKLEQYSLRLALILQMLSLACGETKQTEIGVDATKGALKLIEYFKKTALKVHSIVGKATPLEKLPMDKKNLYEELPETFTTQEGVKIAENIGIPERTFKRFAAQEDLFSNPKRGEYKKKY
ncbi:MAG: DUF3987 domain-containing protein [Saprospiraceae bacterium]|nr:DUF3987 domain-containing protein [Saprospiraceae bacterium]MCB9324001.1 DUF3987 domain-containing protein [Lewinellaceae bacterium]